MHGTFDVEALGGRYRDYVIARLPYAGKSASMYIVFPNMDHVTGKTKISPEQALLTAMKNKEIALFKNGGQGVRKFEAEDVSLPKFAIKYTNAELKDAFRAMGVDKVFSGGNLTNLSSDPRLYVSYIRMDTALEVDEAGSKAAGVASIGMGLESIRVSQFEFNRPFAVVIRDEASGIDLFSGVIRNPKQ
jgi:serine protease inhibitor